MTIERVKGVAKGRVQGVGFRYFVMQNASELGITGWVENMPDGTVEMELQGTPEKIAELTKRIKKGNFIIKVESLEFTNLDVIEEKAFIIRH